MIKLEMMLLMLIMIKLHWRTLYKPGMWRTLRTEATKPVQWSRLYHGIIMGMVVTWRRRRNRIAKKKMNIENHGDDKDGG